VNRTRGPVKGLVAALRRSARVVMVDEYRTSRICPSAWPYGGTCDTYMRRPFKCKGADGTIRVPYQLKVCPHCRVVSPAFRACTLPFQGGRRKAVVFQHDHLLASCFVFVTLAYLTHFHAAGMEPRCFRGQEHAAVRARKGGKRRQTCGPPTWPTGPQRPPAGCAAG